MSMPAIIKRQGQLDLLAYLLIVVLLLAAVLFAFAATSPEPSNLWLLQNEAAAALVVGLLLTVVVYLADGQRRLRRQVEAATAALESAKADVVNSLDGLAFVHRVAALVGSDEYDEGIRQALEEAVGHFGARASAMVRGEEVTIFAAKEADEDLATADVLKAAVQTTAAQRPLAVSVDAERYVIAVPLRRHEGLQHVWCVWRPDTEFTEEQLDELALAGRIAELGIENGALTAEARTALQGTLRAMVTLVDARQPDYSRHSVVMADRAMEVAKGLGLPEDEQNDIRYAALLHDIGTLQVPESILRAERPLTDEERTVIRDHPAKGSRLARLANLHTAVRDGILSHHERVDGGGYPAGLRGDEIPLCARIIAVCDGFDAMTSERPHQQKMSRRAAAAELARKAGTQFDRRVVEVFLDVIGTEISDEPISDMSDIIRQLRTVA